VDDGILQAKNHKNNLACVLDIVALRVWFRGDASGVCMLLLGVCVSFVYMCVCVCVCVCVRMSASF